MTDNSDLLEYTFPLNQALSNSIRGRNVCGEVDGMRIGHTQIMKVGEV